MPSPLQLNDELLRRLELQLRTLEKEVIAVITESEIFHYKRRQDRIRELFTQLLTRESGA